MILIAKYKLHNVVDKTYSHYTLHALHLFSISIAVEFFLDFVGVERGLEISR